MLTKTGGHSTYRSSMKFILLLQRPKISKRQTISVVLTLISKALANKKRPRVIQGP